MSDTFGPVLLEIKHSHSNLFEERALRDPAENERTVSTSQRPCSAPRRGAVR